LNIKFKRLNNLPIHNFHIAIGIDDEYGQRIAHMNNEITDQLVEGVPENCNSINLHIPRFPFKQGTYTFALYSAVNGELADWIQEAGTIDVEAGDFYNTGKLLPEGQGQFLLDYSFKVKQS
jgi:lipopolysaccharide transport system ATP-binding protein